MKPELERLADTSIVSLAQLGVAASFVAFMYFGDRLLHERDYVDAAVSQQCNLIVPNSYVFDKTSIDQVFRDHDGYRVILRTENNSVIEHKFYPTHICPYIENVYPDVLERYEFTVMDNSQRTNFRIVKDLEENEQPYMLSIAYNVTVDYTRDDKDKSKDYNCLYREVHMPLSQGLEPGNEEWGGKYKKYDNIKEID